MIPKAEPQKIPIQVFEESILNDGKWEIEEGRLLFSDDEMRKIILMLIGQIGLKKLKHLTTLSNDGKPYFNHIHIC